MYRRLYIKIITACLFYFRGAAEGFKLLTAFFD